jgi:hypothetical protein
MGYSVRQHSLAVGSYRTAAAVRENRSPNNTAQVMSHSPGPTMKKQISQN